MKPYSPTEFFKKVSDLREFAEKVVRNSPFFFKLSKEVKGKPVSIYGYRNAPCSEFERLSAHELRGLTFVEDRAYLSLHKFFNLNECGSSSQDAFKGLKLLEVRQKIDGTLVQPLPVGGEVLFKTKHSFDHPAAAAAAEVLKHRTGKVKELLETGRIPLFELVSPRLQQVVTYERPKLYLIQVRNLKDGSYAGAKELEEIAKVLKVETPPTEDADLQTLKKRAKAERGIEGWVLRFEGDRFFKLKTNWYLKQHRKLASLSPEALLRLALKGKLDDVVPLLNPLSEKRKLAERIQSSLKTFLEKKIEESLKGQGEFGDLAVGCGSQKDPRLCLKLKILQRLRLRSSDARALKELLKELLRRSA